jgi:transposase-like protein
MRNQPKARRALRKLRDDLPTFFGLAPSHQTIKNWLGIGGVKRIEDQISNYSGYYCYDEQYIKIDGKRAYRLAVFDPLLNVPVTEEIAANIEYNTNF